MRQEQGPALRLQNQAWLIHTSLKPELGALTGCDRAGEVNSKRILHERMITALLLHC